MKARTRAKKRIYTHNDSARVPFSMEDCYDIFRAIFHNEEDALAAMIRLFVGESWGEEYEV
jgi:hypothetical protein